MQEKTIEEKNRLIFMATSLSVVVALCLTIIKIYAAYKTNSMSIVAGLIDSALDIAASVINFFAARWAITPADDDHSLGHGKAEALAGLAQSILISTTALLLIWENIYRLFYPVSLSQIDLGFSVTIISIIFTLLLIAVQNYVIYHTGNLVVKADKEHYKNDIFLNLGILISLFMTGYFTTSLIDNILSIVIAVIMLWGIKDILLQSFDQIMDKELSEEIREKIFRCVMTNSMVKDMHDLRTRTSGSWSFIQFHISLPANITLLQAHIIVEEIEDNLKKMLPQSEIFIHLDPEGNEIENPLPYTLH